MFHNDNKYYFSKNNNRIVLNDEQSVSEKYELNDQKNVYGKLFVQATNQTDITAFSAYMNAIFTYENIEEDNTKEIFCFMSLELFEKICDDIKFINNFNNIVSDTKQFYLDKELQILWNPLLLHPICFEIKDLEIIYRPIKSLVESVSKQILTSNKICSNSVLFDVINAKKSMQKYIDAHKIYFEKALTEIKNKKKTSHWMWYIFPQVLGLGLSEKSNYYAIKNIYEAKAFIFNEYLYTNLLKICNELYKAAENDIVKIMGELDSLKLKSSMTLFSVVDNKTDIFEKILDKYFDGQKDEETIEIVNNKFKKHS